MANIKLLDKDTINKIAAGEVVERPSSVVKELVENSIDAGATMITCEIKDGGKAFIRITDNGSGIDTDDIKTAFLRHSTSKIKDEKDLDNIKSLGFRGEALSSISAVSKVEMLTKRADDFLGSRYVIEGGLEKSFDEAGCPDGTTFIVRDIFYNTPARRKFLKSGMTEAGYINDLINRLAISHPEISFRFINQGKTVLFTNGNGNEKDTLYSIFGRDVVSNLIAVDFHSSYLDITGYIGKPVILRGNRSVENYYINGRYSKSHIITRAIEEAYKGYAMQHKYPFVSLHFNIPLDKLDINVHPTKMEVRISEGDFYYTKVYQVVSDALKSANMIVAATVGKEVNGSFKPDTEKLSQIPQSFETNRLREQSNYGANTNEKDKSVLSKNTEIISAVSEKNPSISAVNLNADKLTKITASENIKTNNASTNGYYEKINNNTDTSSKNEYAERIIINTDYSDTINPNLAGSSKTALNNDIEINTDKLIKATNIDDINVNTDRLYKVEKSDGINANTSKNNNSQSNASPVSDLAIKSPTKEFEQLSFDITNQEFMQDKNADKFKIVGQVFATYWIVELKDQMYIIDQHAAHEKILYERTIKRYREQEAASQQLYPPIVVTLSLSEIDVLEKYKEHFEKLGFEISSFGGREYSITAIPCELFKLTGEGFFHDLLDQLVSSPIKGDIDAVVDRIATMSCKAAIKGNETYTVMEAENLIKELLKLENPFHCPHGRPIIITMSKYEIEKKFKRIL
jgi:DNA mismatch repair protein MutL